MNGDGSTSNIQHGTPNAQVNGKGNKIELTQDVFDGHPPEVVVACVDYDGLLKFGDGIHIRYTWASERWRGANWLTKVGETDYEPLTSLIREPVASAKPSPTANCQTPIASDLPAGRQAERSTT